MKAEELMIGDWVLAEGNPVQVTNISILGGDIIRVISPFMSYDVAYASNIVALSKGAKDINMIEPIPLTTEILEKNGYEESEIGYKIPNSKLYIIERGYDFEEKRWSIGTFEIVGKGEPSGEAFVYVNSVHELQHVLKLCKIEKEIAL